MGALRGIRVSPPRESGPSRFPVAGTGAEDGCRNGDDAGDPQARRGPGPRPRRGPGTDARRRTRSSSRIEAASHLRHRPAHRRAGTSGRSSAIEPPLTLGHEFCGTVVDDRRHVRDVAEGDYVSAESHVTCGVCFHCRTGQRAHVRAHADPRRRSRRRLRRATSRCRRRSSGRTTARSFRPRSRPCRSRSATPSSRPVTQDLAGRRGRGPRLRAGRPLQRSRSRARRAPAACSPRTARRSGSTSRGRWAPTRSIDVDDASDIVAGFAEQNEGAASRRRLRDVRRRRGDRRLVPHRAQRRPRDPLRDSRAARSRSTSPRRSSSRTSTSRRSAAARSGRRGTDALAARARRRRPAPADHRELALDGFEDAFELLASGDACKIVLRPEGGRAATVAAAAGLAA